MKFGSFWILLLPFLVAGTSAQEGFDLADAFDDLTPVPANPKEQPKAPEKPKSDDGFDLFDALGPAPTPKDQPEKKPKNDDELDLFDALGPDLKPDKPVVDPPKGGGGGGKLDDSDLYDLSGGDYKPDKGRGHGGGDAGYDNQGGADQPQEAGSGQIAGIVSAIGVALLGALSTFCAYQKKKLCFKLQGGADPESGKGHHGTQSDPQVFSNLLRTS